MTERVNRSLVLVSRPVGVPKESDYRIEESAVPELADGQFLVRNAYMSVDPYMRGMMRGLELGTTPSGGAVGHVVESRNADYPEGVEIHADLWKTWHDAYQADVPPSDYKCRDQSRNPDIATKALRKIAHFFGGKRVKKKLSLVEKFVKGLMKDKELADRIHYDEADSDDD